MKHKSGGKEEVKMLPTVGNGDGDDDDDGDLQWRRVAGQRRGAENYDDRASSRRRRQAKKMAMAMASICFRRRQDNK